MKITQIELNKSIPFEVNIFRVVGLICIILLIYSLKTKEFWKEAYDRKNFKQNLVLMIIIDIGILVVFFINQGCSNQGNDMYNDNLVKALSKGEVSISGTPDTYKLEALDNPYDAVERSKLARNTDYIWDAAYFHQKYYVYFGVLPALFIMVPYYLITHQLLSSAIVTLIFSLLSIPVLAILTKKVFQKYFKELPFQYMVFSVLMMIFGTMLIWINVAPRFYELVTVAGFFFATLGFLLIFDAEKEEGQISYQEIFLGSFSLAASVACRPTQFFASLLVVPILLRILKNVVQQSVLHQKIDDIKNTKNKWSTLSSFIKLMVVVAIPYLIVAILMMRYNYLRFGSPFDFGEKYQLTVNNMKDLAIRWAILPTGILCNLFGLPTFQAVFPFLHANGNIIDTFGYYYVEDMPGGVFFLAPICFFCFGIGKLWKESRNKELKIFATSLLIVGLIFTTFISLKAGSTGRYLLDFAWLFVLCGIVIFMEIFRKLETDEGKKILGKVFSVIVCFTLIINILTGFCTIGGTNSMRHNSPKQYFDAEYTIMFLK